MTDPTQPNRVEQYLSHVAAIVEPIAVAAFKAEAVAAIDMERVAAIRERWMGAHTGRYSAATEARDYEDVAYLLSLITHP